MIGTTLQRQRQSGHRRCAFAVLAVVASHLVAFGGRPQPAGAVGPGVLNGLLAYTTDGDAVYVIDSVGKGVLARIPVPGAGEAVVSPDGRRVYVRSTAGISSSTRQRTQSSAHGRSAQDRTRSPSHRSLARLSFRLAVTGDGSQILATASGSRSRAPNGRGVEQTNWPGFPATPGPKRLSFWALAPTPGLGAAMTVDWRDGTGAILRSDVVRIGSLAATWKEGATIVDAPAGTTRVSVELSGAGGQPGNLIFVDDIVVEPSAVAPSPSPANNHLDADTATLEGSSGKWIPWFSSTVSQSADHAAQGTRSLRVDVTAPYGWGVQLGNWPGFAAGAGPKRLSFWGLAPTGAGLGATMTVEWRNGAGGVLGTGSVTLALGTTWTEAAADVIAPPGTTRVTVELSDPAGLPGQILYFDDLLVADR